MPELTPEHNEQILAACRESADSIGESLSRCLDVSGRIEVGRLQPWDPDQPPAEWAGPGLVVQFPVGEQALCCLLPASLPLPEWCREPAQAEEARLHELAAEWSERMLPEALQTDRFATVFVSDLQAEVQRGRPADSATMLALSLVRSDQAESTGDGERRTDASAESSDAPATEASESSPQEEAEPAGRPGRLWLIGPLTAPPLPAVGSSEGDTAATAPGEEETAGPGPDPVRSSGESGSQRSRDEAAPRPRRSTLLSKLPVTISVRLAEKRIELGQLLSLTPGALITFSKSCDELLDLYVNNHHYCRGEAVKIGEKFGLKVNTILVQRKQSDRPQSR